MRKKSHISLGSYLVNSLDASELQHHRKAFLLGSILPDLKPSFLTQRHEFGGTYFSIQENIRKLSVEGATLAEKQRVYWRRMGEIIHYLADYFTLPHNAIYSGGLRQHCVYEKHLKNNLKEYIISGEALEQQRDFRKFHNLKELFDYIEYRHQKYLQIAGNIETDIRYITDVCLQVISGIYQLFLKTISPQGEFEKRAALAV